MASIVECLPRAARSTLVFLLDHLALVVAAQDRNKMSPNHLAVALAPPLMLHSQPPADLDYQRPIQVLQCLLQIWPPPKRSGNVISKLSHLTKFSHFTLKKILNKSTIQNDLTKAVAKLLDKLIIR